MVKDLKELTVLGLMSGTSLDGLDLAFCRFRLERSSWKYEILKAKTKEYPPDLRDSLKDAINLSEKTLSELDHSYGKWLGTASAEFISESGLKPDWIASHGHTVFHEPHRGITLQIGNGNELAKLSGINVVCDFRSQDIALGGQGAPLVPVGDEYLFGEYDQCLNLGGISNISFRKDEKRIAFDICPVNMALNMLAEEFGSAFDRNGELGKGGNILSGLLDQLNSLEYYAVRPPKSLGREWFDRQVRPLLYQNVNKKDILRTYYEHASVQIGSVLNENGRGNVLVTGGGAKNSFLLKLIKQKTNSKLIVPGQVILDFKEALIFAFLGYLKVNNINNVFASVTGSSADHCSGTIYIV
jgi:anhydro-N-acetylmuramic acid kinase